MKKKCRQRFQQFLRREFVSPVSGDEGPVHQQSNTAEIVTEPFTEKPKRQPQTSAAYMIDVMVDHQTTGGIIIDSFSRARSRLDLPAQAGGEGGELAADHQAEAAQDVERAAAVGDLLRDRDVRLRRRDGRKLYAPVGESKPLRVQGCYISDEEIEDLCEFIRNQGESQYSEEIQKEIDNKAVQEKGSSQAFTGEESSESLDPLFEKAVEVILENGRASTSFLERKLGVGYSRGSKIMDQVEEKGIIGPHDGAKLREIRITMQQWIQMKANGSVDFTSENTEQMSFEDSQEESLEEDDDMFDVDGLFDDDDE
ncbi:MAG: hypothetical protein IKR97_01670 [Eubacterium sp.]|nr:hypothetical protein [Eubacterium sp.]